MTWDSLVCGPQVEVYQSQPLANVAMTDLYLCLSFPIHLLQVSVCVRKQVFGYVVVISYTFLCARPTHRC